MSTRMSIDMEGRKQIHFRPSVCEYLIVTDYLHQQRVQ